MKAKKKPKKKKPAPPKNGAPALDLEAAKAALDQADQDYIDAVAGGDPDTINLARRALMIAIANYIAAANAG